MAQILILGIMLGCAVVPFGLVTYLMRSGQSGLALTIIGAIVGVGAVYFYASGRPFGIDPIFAMAVFLLGCVPALLGSLAGALLGWILRGQDDQKTKY